MIGFAAGILLLSVFFVLWAQTRSFQLKRMANTLRLRYDRELNSLLTPENEEKLALFAQGAYRFTYVLTGHESGAFVRLSQASFRKGNTVTLVSVELTAASFTPLCLYPKKKEETLSSILPPDLAARYTLKAPPGYALPEEVLGFLRATRPCYLELTSNALVYHEFDSKPIRELQPLRWRIMQLVKVLAKQPEPQPVSTVSEQLTTESLEATLKLKNLSLGGSSFETSAPSAAGGHGVYAIILVLLLGGLCLLAWFALHQLPGR